MCCIVLYSVVSWFDSVDLVFVCCMVRPCGFRLCVLYRAVQCCIVYHCHLAADERPYIAFREGIGQKPMAVTLLVIFLLVVLEVKNNEVAA